MRLILVVQQFYPQRGSYSSVFENIAKRASQKGFDVTILTTRQPGQPSIERLTYATIHRFPVPHSPFLNFFVSCIALSRHVRRYLAANASRDCIIIANGDAAFGIRHPHIIRVDDQPAWVFWRRMLGSGSLISHIGRFCHCLAQYLIEYVTVGKACGLIFSSRENRELFIRSYGVGSSSYFIPRSGIDTDMFSTSSRKKESTTLLFIAMNDERERKGVSDLELALPLVFSKHPSVRLLHLGDPFKWRVPSWCRSRIDQPGKVFWRDMPRYYAQADIYVSCSRSEGFPNAILEAMAVGMPIISSDIIGIREYVHDERQGIFYTSGRPNQLVQALNRLLASKTVRVSMGCLNKKRVASLDNKTYSDSLLSFSSQVCRGINMQYNLLRRT